MGCISSKQIERGNSFSGRRRQSLKRLVASSEGDDTVVFDVDARLGRESIDGGRVRLIPEPKENDLNLAPLPVENGIVKAGTSSDNTEKSRVQERLVSHDGRASQANLSSVAGDDEDKQQQQQHNLFKLSNGVLTDHEAAGWPSWLTKVAGEAVKGWLPRKLDSFSNMEKTGARFPRLAKIGSLVVVVSLSCSFVLAVVTILPREK